MQLLLVLLSFVHCNPFIVRMRFLSESGCKGRHFFDTNKIFQHFFCELLQKYCKTRKQGEKQGGKRDDTLLYYRKQALRRREQMISVDEKKSNSSSWEFIYHSWRKGNCSYCHDALDLHHHTHATLQAHETAFDALPCTTINAHAVAFLQA